jgi:hypothetical protein
LAENPARPTAVGIALALHGLVFIIALFDIWAIWKYGPASTVSAVVTEWARSYPALPFLIGFLMGHLFG